MVGKVGIFAKMLKIIQLADGKYLSLTQIVPKTKAFHACLMISKKSKTEQYLMRLKPPSKLFGGL
jgi:hypothetical protein